MGPQTLAMSFATIVGLICNFRQERATQNDLDQQKFLEWLDYHRHEQIKNFITQNSHISMEIDKLLQRNHEDILTQFGTVSEILASIFSRLDDFTGLTQAILPNLELSKQARDVLVMFHDSEAELLIFSPHIRPRPVLILSPGHGVEINEPRFIEDDLNTLVALGFLAPDFTSDGDPMFRLTRNGSKYVCLLKEQQKK